MAIPIPSITNIRNNSSGVSIEYNSNATLADNTDTIYCYRGESANPTTLIDQHSTNWIFPTGEMASQWLYDYEGRAKSINGNTRYYYRLRCSYNGVYGDYSQTESILTCPAPTHAELISSDTTSATFFVSYDPSGSASTTRLKYHIEEVEGGYSAEIDTRIINMAGGSTVTYQIYGLNPGTWYLIYFYMSNVSGNGRISELIFLNEKTAKFYGSVNNAAQKAEHMYGSINGRTKQIRKLYGSVNGRAKLIFQE